MFPFGEITDQIGLALRDSLEDAGIAAIQVDEPALRELPLDADRR